jgi:hypothetical protein
VLLRSLPVRCSTGPPPRDTVPPITGVDPLTPRGCILGSTRGRFTVFGLGAVCRKSTPVATPLSPTGLPCPLAQQRIVVVEVTVREPF